MRILKQFRSIPWLAEVLSFIGYIIFAIQTWTYSHTQVSILDEGNYLIKGLLFVRGQYTIYQDYGPWSNHMPLSFYIPGFVQHLFGPGLRTGRYFAFVLGMLLLLGIWLVAHRWGGRWWAALSVWAMAINPAILKIYSTVSSQVLIAFLLVWVLVFVLAEKRTMWQLILGSVLAGGMLMTRINLAPFLPILLFYIFWQHGKRAGLWSLLAMGGVVLIGHTLFWPGILRMWATWIPTNIAPFLEPFKSPEGTHYWDPSVDLFGRTVSFFSAVRYHMVAIVSVIATLLLWPRKSDWQSPDHFRASVFLVISFAGLFFAHFWVSIGAGISSNKAYSSSYCVFCFQSYLAFFSFLGILLVVIASPSWRHKVSWWRCLVIILVVLILPAGIGLTLRSQVSNELVSYRTIQTILNWEVPRLSEFRIKPGTIELWGLIANRTGLEIQGVHLLIRKNIKTGLVVFSGIMFGVGVLVTSWLGFIILKKRGNIHNFNWCYLSLVIFVSTGLILSPFWFLGGEKQDYECKGDVLASYDAVGRHLVEEIPPGALIYWKGGLSPAPLLYLDDFQVFPPLLNGAYTFRESGNEEALVKYGLWNRHLAEKWAQEATVVLIEESRFGDGIVENVINSGEYKELASTPPKAPCKAESAIRIFLREP